jgi:hypothetical protein
MGRKFCSLMNPLLVTTEIESFLHSFPSKNGRRGKNIYESGWVFEVSCIESDRRFKAMVEGMEDNAVTFDYDAARRMWSVQCTCSESTRCKHAYAGMLALQANATKLSAPTPAPKAKSGRGKKTKQPVAKVVEGPQMPSTAVSKALTLALGRNLDRAEVEYVQRIQWLYRQSANGQWMTNESLRHLSTEVKDYSWTHLTLWQEFPRDDLQFWLYCAWELRKRGLDIPELMQPVTDFSDIEPAMRAWERQKQIEFWRTKLANGDTASDWEIQPVDFRLMILPTEVQVQWKRPSEEKFKDLKHSHLGDFNKQYMEGTMAVEAEAIPLWLAIHNPYDTHTALHYEYDRSGTTKMLSRVLQLPSLAGRIVSSEGVPLERATEALRYQMDPAQDESGDYAVSLLRADGSPAPPVLVAVPGKPALYLTPQAVYPGPPPHGFNVREPLRIPAPALECVEGVNFLQRLKLDLPPRILERTRPLNVVVKVSCQINPTYPGSQAQAVFIRVTSEVEGGETEHCTSSGWVLPGYGQKKQNGKNGLIPLVNRSVQSHFPGQLQSLGAKWDGYRTTWSVRLTKKFPEVFVPWLASLPPEIVVELDRELATLRDAPVSGTVRLDLTEAGVDWFDLKVALKVTDLKLTPEELKLLLNARGGFVRLEKKGWRRLQVDMSPEDDEALARLGLNSRDFTAEPQRLHALQLADQAARKLLPEAQAEQIHRRAAELKTRVTPAVPAGIRAELRPYQIDGFHFLSYLTTNRFGGVLADDMGLGKTLQTLTWLAWLRGGGANAPAGDNASQTEGNGNSVVILPSLVVCPKSVMDNWRTEAQRFCAGLRVRLWEGEEAAALAAARAEADLIVLNYPQLRSLSPEIAQHRWQVVILDEAQYIKNPDSQTAQVARTLQADHRLALTGTPIENRLLDLWSIFAFAMPGVLGNRAQFARSYDAKDDPLARRRLAARVRPFLLRRAKSQVAQDLPDRVEEDLACVMEGEQKTLYRAEFKRAQQLLLSVNTQKQLNEQRFNFLTSLLRLRQICCHPALVSEELKNAESAKLNALLDLLEPLMEEGHKVLVFSQFVTMLDILRETVKQRGWTHFYLAGETENRGDLVEAFQNSKGSAVFLISLKAGGFGLNLTAASYVVLFDPWWNPAVEMQAIDRTHRIGQTSKVMAYRLLMKDSIEQKIRELQRSKAALAEDVLGEEKFSQSLTLDDLRFLFGE